MASFIKIPDSPAVALSSILAEFCDIGPALYWSIFHFWGVAKPDNNVDLATLDEKSKEPNGYQLSWQELFDIADQLVQLIDANIIGATKTEDLICPASETEIRQRCEVFIEAFDSTYWRVFSKHTPIVDRLAVKFSPVEILD